MWPWRGKTIAFHQDALIGPISCAVCPFAPENASQFGKLRRQLRRPSRKDAILAAGALTRGYSNYPALHFGQIVIESSDAQTKCKFRMHFVCIFTFLIEIVTEGARQRSVLRAKGAITNAVVARGENKFVHAIDGSWRTQMRSN